MFFKKNKPISEFEDAICEKYIAEFKKDVNKNKQNLKYELNRQIAYNSVLGKQALEYLEQKADDCDMFDLAYLSLMLRLTEINEQYQKSIEEFIEDD